MKNSSIPNDPTFNSNVVGREIFNFMLESAVDGFWYWNLENPKEDWINDRFWETLGYFGEHIPTETAKLKDVIFPEDLNTLNTKSANFIANQEKNCELSIRFIHKNGTTLWMRAKGTTIKNDAGVPIRMLVALINVTEEKKKEGFLTTCNTAANIGYWEVDLENSTVFWSSMVREFYRVSDTYQPDLEKAYRFYKEGEHRDLIMNKVADAIENGVPYNIESIQVTLDGEEKWAKSIGFPEMYNGKCVRLYGTFQDIDARKRSEIEVLTLLEKSTEQNKRLRNFKNIVSHNMRSHSGNMEFLIDLFGRDKPELKDLEVFKLLKSASNNLSETIHQLNNVSTISNGDNTELVPLSLSYFARKAVNAVHGQAQKANVKVINEVETNKEVLGVAAYLESIILNFLTNSIRYKSDQRESYVRLYTTQDLDSISLHIEDNGLGIDLDRHRDKLFGMYKTFHVHPDSKGIGLFITKNQIDAINATVDVASEVDKGTTFIINFTYEKN